jgi:HEPN domain-containing protein
MSSEEQSRRPPETATPRQILDLANEYRRAAENLSPTTRRGAPLSRSPYRLVAIHAIELYLNALLLTQGHSYAALPRLRHNLISRARLAEAAKLVLRKRTLRHLASLSASGEYVIARYDPAARAASELNRLAATVSEVAGKVSGLVAAAEKGSASAR